MPRKDRVSSHSEARNKALHGECRIYTIIILKEEAKRSLAHLCMCYYYISLHNNIEIYAQSA